MALKNPGGKTLSNLQSIMLILHCISYNLSTLNTIEQRFLKNSLNSTSGSNTSSGRAWNAISISIYKNTWQSWLFMFWNFTDFISTQFTKLEQYPSGIVSYCAHSHIPFRLSKERAYMAFGISVRPLTPRRTFSSFRSHISAISSLTLTSFFVLPGTSITVLMMLSQKFFSMCITSKLWCSSWSP